MIVPPAVRPGDRVHVIAPSGAFEAEQFERGLAFLRQHLDVVMSPDIYDRQGFFAGNDERRRRELNQALADPRASAVIVARGGHGLIRIVAGVDVAALARHPKWLVGFSDVTCLHLAAQRFGIASIHGQNVTSLGDAAEDERRLWLDHLGAPLAAQTFRELEVWRNGVARGPLWGGNLTLLFVTAAAGRLELPKGCILFLEEITEQPYRVDRMLSALTLSGALDRVGGVVLGDMTACDGPAHQPDVWQVLQEHLLELGVPLARGLPAGHGKVNRSLTLGLPSELDASRGTFTQGV